MDLCKLYGAFGLPFILEQAMPKQGATSMFMLPPLQALLDLGAVDFDFRQCMIGAAMAKPTRVSYKKKVREKKGEFLHSLEKEKTLFFQ